MIDIIINDLPKKISHAGFKARQDALDIISKKYPDAKVINISSGLSIFSRIISSLMLLIKGFFFKEGAICFANYPLARPRWAFLCVLKKIKRIRVIALIHDLESLRGKNNQDFIDLNRCDFILSHNNRMTKLLRENNVIKPDIIDIDLFDYLMRAPIEDISFSKAIFSPTILFAGNLSEGKSGFLYGWHPEINVDLYGINLGSIHGKLLSWKGAFDANEPKLDSSKQYIGLVWDGESTETCKGFCGEYLKLNNPHKISLYLSQGIPIIVWSQSALASFVLSNKVGCVVDNLNDMNTVMSSISFSEYIEFRNNAATIGNKLRSGYYLSSAIDKIRVV